MCIRDREEKRRRNAADFSDQEHEAIDLLLGADGQPTDLARTVSQLSLIHIYRKNK